MDLACRESENLANLSISITGEGGINSAVTHLLHFSEMESAGTPVRKVGDGLL